MQPEQLKLMSLNVNGLGNPIKGSKLMATLKWEKVSISLQETRLAQQEHEKMKKKMCFSTLFSGL